MLATVAGVAVLAPAAVLAACCLRIRGLAPFLLAVLTLASAIVVGLTLALSAFGVYERGAMLAAELAVVLAAGGWWLVAGRPHAQVALPSRSEVLVAARAHRTVSVMVLAALLAALVEAFLALAIVPNSWDSLMYHLSRAALWIQEGSVFGIEATVFETEHQPNGEMLYGWTLLLSDGDRLAALVPWLAAVGCGLIVFCGARMLSFRRSAAVFAAALFVTLPQIVVQASSTLVDLPAAFFVGSFALFVVRAISNRSAGDLVVASLALGLAIGTKGTAFIAAPGLVLIVIAALVRWRPPGRMIVTGAVALGLGALALGSPKYIENAIDGGSPAGEAGQVVLRESSLPRSAAKTAWSFVDLPGLEGSFPASVTQRIHDRVWAAGEDPFGDTYVSEDGIGFGPLGFLLLLPLLAYFALTRRGPPSRRLIALAAGSFFVVAAIVLEPYANASHVMVTGVLLGAPLLAWACGIPWVRHLSAFVAIATLIPVLATNQLKPLYPDPAIGLDRATTQGLQHDFAPALARIDELLPSDARLAFIGPPGATWDYPFFGPHLDRYVHRIEAEPATAPSRAEVEALIAADDLDAVVFSGVAPPAGMETEEIGNIAFSDTVVHLPSILATTRGRRWEPPTIGRLAERSARPRADHSCLELRRPLIS